MTRTPVAILIADASTHREVVETIITQTGFRPLVVDNRWTERRSVQRVSPDLCVAICDKPATTEARVRSYRDLWPRTPLVVLTATHDHTLTAQTLEAGADDVLSIHRADAQLAARIRALWRRYRVPAGHRGPIPLVAGDLRIDFGTRRVWTGGREVSLSPTEFRILQKLSMHIGRVVPHREILLAVWGDQRPELTEALRVYIRNLRQKVQSDRAVAIVTRPGIGYMLSVPST